MKRQMPDGSYREVGAKRVTDRHAFRQRPVVKTGMKPLDRAVPRRPARRIQGIA